MKTDLPWWMNLHPRRTVFTVTRFIGPHVGLQAVTVIRQALPSLWTKSRVSFAGIGRLGICFWLRMREKEEEGITRNGCRSLWRCSGFAAPVSGDRGKSSGTRTRPLPSCGVGHSLCQLIDWKAKICVISSLKRIMQFISDAIITILILLWHWWEYHIWRNR